jgi:hypothetical protein
VRSTAHTDNASSASIAIDWMGTYVSTAAVADKRV